MFEVQKEAAAMAAVAEIQSGMLIGLGTGSTAAFAIRHLGHRVRSGELSVHVAATSLATEKLAQENGLALIDFTAVSRVDLTIDGADEIDRRLFAIKGAGGAMLREKIVAAASDRMIVVADSSKAVEQIGKAPIPVELLPFAQKFASAALAELGGKAQLRSLGNELYRTDQGNLVIDCHFAELPDPAGLAAKLSTIPGLLGHGLFLTEIDAAYIATDKGVRLWTHPS